MSLKIIIKPWITIIKKNNQARIKTLKELKSNKPLGQIYPQQQEIIKTNSQIHTKIEARNSVPNNKCV